MTIIRILLLVLSLAVPVLFFALAVVTGDIGYFFVAILFVAAYIFPLHKGKDKCSNIAHKENFCDGLTYEEYVEKYGEPEDWMVPWKRD